MRRRLQARQGGARRRRGGGRLLGMPLGGLGDWRICVVGFWLCG
uniref:Uncharacterized protein n=1 Tax=Arundo donax TaxID=35708 RepID=A0A0A9FU21_ARUDO